MSTIANISETDNITDSRTTLNNNFIALNADKVETSVLDTDTTLAANSDLKVPTQKAVKAYVDAGGNVNASTTAKGIVEEATQAEVNAGTATGGSGARLYVNPSTIIAPKCYVYQNAAGSTGSSSFSTISFQVESFDTDSMHESVTNPSRITFNTAGKYAIGATIKQDAQRATDIKIILNGSTEIAYNSGGSLMNPSGVSVFTIYEFSQGDYIEVQGASNGAGTTSGDIKTHFWAFRIN